MPKYYSDVKGFFSSPVQDGLSKMWAFLVGLNAFSWGIMELETLLTF